MRNAPEMTATGIEPAVTGNDGGAEPVKTALVTGSTAGIGLATAEALVAQGWRVCISARSADDVERRADQLRRRTGRQVIGLAADVSQPQSVVELFARVFDQMGPLDLLVNNAGAAMTVDAVAMTPAEWHAVVDTTLTGTFLCSQQAASHMLPRRHGVIVNISSVFGHGAMDRRAAYVAAKHGVEGLTRALALEWGPLGIRVVAVSPSFVLTERLAAAADAGTLDVEPARRRSPLGRLASPQDVAAAVVFAASDAASFVTGTTLAVDGGWLADVGW